MDRRKFVKNIVLTAAGAFVIGAAANITNNNVVNQKIQKGDKKMKILVITGSPRRNGNSNTLADKFIEGAKEAGHTVVRFDSAFKNVHPCIACNKCGMNGECIFKDDFEFVRNNIIDSDAVVFVTPMYYFGISAQLKAVIDRFYAINGQIHKPKKAVLIMTYADTAAKEAQPIINHYDTLLNYLGWSDSGKIIASGVWTEGSVNNTPYLQQAYELGKNI